MSKTPPCNVDILLVDDNPLNLIALDALLGDVSANLVKVRSGAEALKQLLDEDAPLHLKAT